MNKDGIIASMYRRFRIDLQFEDQVRGGVPKNPDTIEAWIKSRIDDIHKVDDLSDKLRKLTPGEQEEEAAKIIAATKEEMGIGDLSQEELKSVSTAVWNGFKRNGDGLYLEGRCVKAMLKEAANVLKDIPSMGFTALKARVAERFFVEEQTIPLGLSEPHGVSEGFVHAMTASGPINALKKVDYVEKATIHFHVRTLNTAFVSKEKKEKLDAGDLLAVLMEYAQWGGLGAERSQGHGRFKVLSIEPVE